MSFGSGVSGGVASPGGGGGGGGVSDYNAQVFLQSPPAKSWTVVHSFQRCPNIAVYDSTGQQVFPDITVINSSTIRIDFSGASDGTAILT